LVIVGPESNLDSPPESELVEFPNLEIPPESVLAVLAGLLPYFGSEDPESDVARLDLQLLVPLELYLLLEYPVSVEVV
jgi:hypothetical protein